MTDLTPTFSELLRSKSPSSKLSTGYMTTEIADEFLKEAYRIVLPTIITLHPHSDTNNHPN